MEFINIKLTNTQQAKTTGAYKQAQRKNNSKEMQPFVSIKCVNLIICHQSISISK
jgi:hypothetical protein